MKESVGFCPQYAFIETLILWILHRKLMHGYRIRKEIEQLTSEEYIPKSGVIYTILRRMERKGLLKSKWSRDDGKRDKRIYNITEKGEKLLKQRLKMIKKRIRLLEQMVSYYDKVFSDKEDNL